MSEKRASLEVIAPSVEEAVAKGLADLGLSEDGVDVEVLDSGSRGLFGLGTRQARVRLTVKVSPTEEPSVSMGVVAEPTITGVKGEVAPPEAAVPEELPESLLSTSLAEYATAPEISVMQVEPPAALAARITVEQEAAIKIAVDTAEELLKKMKVRARVSARFTEPDDAHSKAALLVDVRGDDLSILIGPKAETLNAFQYITSLIVGKELGHAIPLVVDVEGYRARRTQQIRHLARRMAEQAIRTGRRQVLEPMPANERRLVHIELRSNLQVTTESVGEEPRRKVTIIPVDEKR